MGTTFTLLDDRRATIVDAETHGTRVRVLASDVARATGWVRKSEGLCRDGVCVPVDDGDLDAGDRIDLERLAAALRRPLAHDAEERVAFLGTAAHDRSAALSSLRAPDISLPDLDGRMHALAEQRGKKVLLVVYASW